jgi:streptogramin lyase
MQAIPPMKTASRFTLPLRYRRPFTVNAMTKIQLLATSGETALDIGNNKILTEPSNPKRKRLIGALMLLMTGLCAPLTIGTQPAIAAGVDVTTLTGNGTRGFFDGTGGRTGTTQFGFTTDIAIDSSGNIYVADASNHRIRKTDPTTGATTTLAGNGTAGFFDGTGGPTGTTQFNYPYGIGVDSNGTVYVADQLNYRIRKIDPTTGATTTLAGNGRRGFFDGTGGPTGTTQFKGPADVAVDNLGFVYVTDFDDHRIRKIDGNTGATITLAGNGTFDFFDGTGGPTGTTKFAFPSGIAVDNTGYVYVTDNCCLVRKINATTGETTTLAGTNVGYADGTGGVTGTAKFNEPRGVVSDNNGNLYVADLNGRSIRKINSATGETTTLAGGLYEGDRTSVDGTGSPTGTLRLEYPWGVAVGNDGTVYVADFRIRKIQPSLNMPPPPAPATTTTIATTTTSTSSTTTTTTTTIALIFLPIPQASNPPTTPPATQPTSTTTVSPATSTPSSPTTTTKASVIAIQPATATTALVTEAPAPASPIDANPTFAG